MVERMKSKRRIMKEFEISELSSVDRPAQAPARALLMKRADDEDLEKGKGNPNHKGPGEGGGQFTSGPGGGSGGSGGSKGGSTGKLSVVSSRTLSSKELALADDVLDEALGNLEDEVGSSISGPGPGGRAEASLVATEEALVRLRSGKPLGSAHVTRLKAGLRMEASEGNKGAAALLTRLGGKISKSEDQADDEDLEKGKGNPNHKGPGEGGGQFTSGPGGGSGGSGGSGSGGGKFGSGIVQLRSVKDKNGDIWTHISDEKAYAANAAASQFSSLKEFEAKTGETFADQKGKWVQMINNSFEYHTNDAGEYARPRGSTLRESVNLRTGKSKEITKDYPSTICQQVQAVDFDTVLAEQEAREAASEIGDDLREKWCALQRAFNTIAADESITASDKITAMQTSMAQYIDSLAEQSDEIAESMTKALTAVPAIAELLAKDDTTEGDDPMTDAEKKQIADLTKNVEELTIKLAAATAAEPAKKSAELQKALSAAQAQVTELTEKAAQAEAEKAEAVIKAGMSDAEKAYADAQDEKGKKEFMGMSPEDRKKKMTKAADADPVIYKAADGTEFRKSDDARLVDMAKRADNLEKQNIEEIEKRENAEFSKQAESEPFTFYKGEATDKVKVVRAISKIEDESTRKALTEMLEVGGKAIGAAFKSLGHQDENVQKSAADFNKRVSEIASRDKISKSKAMSKARAEYPDEFAAFQASGAPAN